MPHRAVLALFTLTLFLNAALLFAVQPMFSKMALPLLGGAPAVWNTCMLVFQALLLGGYLYAHLTTRWLRTSRQVLLHLALLVASLLVLPVAVPSGWTPPPGGAPIPWLIGLLLAGLGLPFLLLSTGAPLLQHWFTRTGHPSASNPYFLYAASNAGSMIALLAYPFLLEPTLGLRTQSQLWSWGYAGAVLLIAACAAAALRGRGAQEGEVGVTMSGAGEATTPLSASSLATPRPSSPLAQDAGTAGEPATPPGARTRERIWWTLLAFAPSSLLLGVTTYLTTDMAAIPLLWVVPLAVYLLTFVLVFARRPPLPHGLMLWIHPLVLLPVAAVLFIGSTRSLLVMGPLHLLLFFVTAMVCHGELARLRPGAERLTEFYLFLSIGGVLGGVFNVLLAPVLFDRILEYQLVLAVACALRPWPSDEEGGRDRAALRRDITWPLCVFGGILLVLRWPGPWHPIASMYAVPAVGALAAMLCVLFVKRPLRLALGVLGLLMASLVTRTDARQPLLRDRSFFGVYGVSDLGNGYYTLYHGTTLHGAQNRRPDLRRNPLTYYRLMGPLGDLVALQRLGGRPLDVGVVGLGTGSAACHARAGDDWTFYEIDPAIVRIAQDTTWFTYLHDCTPEARIVLGDARLSLAQDPEARYDLLVVDAFSSDAIPAHLLTREALALYLSRVSENGVVALHVSNRYLDLRPIVGNLAAELGAVAMVGSDFGLAPELRGQLYSGSRWIAVARNEAALQALQVKDDARWLTLERDPEHGVWTDDYSNVLEVLIR